MAEAFSADGFDARLLGYSTAAAYFTVVDEAWCCFAAPWMARSLYSLVLVCIMLVFGDRNVPPKKFDLGARPN